MKSYWAVVFLLILAIYASHIRSYLRANPNSVADFDIFDSFAYFYCAT